MDIFIYSCVSWIIVSFPAFAGNLMRELDMPYLEKKIKDCRHGFFCLKNLYSKYRSIKNVFNN